MTSLFGKTISQLSTELTTLKNKTKELKRKKKESK